MTGHTYTLTHTDQSYLETHDTHDLSLKQTIDRLKTKYCNNCIFYRKTYCNMIFQKTLSVYGTYTLEKCRRAFKML